jgi:hypothetical protein
VSPKLPAWADFLGRRPVKASTQEPPRRATFVLSHPEGESVGKEGTVRSGDAQRSKSADAPAIELWGQEFEAVAPLLVP